jgi:pimeloyl-ACP methyl ester carboxylesterase
VSLRSRLEDALSRAGGAIDRGSMRVIQRAMQRQGGVRRPPHDARLRLAELARHYGASEAALFAPPPAPAELTLEPRARRARATAVHDASWPSRYRASYPGYQEDLARYAANGTAHARLYQGPGRDRPVVLCLHGWGAGQPWLDERAFLVPYLLHIGLDVALLQLPYHGQRAPVQAPRSGSLFLTSHLVRTNEAFGQAIHDARALTLALRARGAPSVGVLGMSLGAYVGALWASLDDDLAFAGALIPAVSLGALWWSHGEGMAARRNAERSGVDEQQLAEVFAVHAPLARPPRLPRERLFIAASRGDRITPPAQAEALWRHWGEPEMVWMAGGHLAQLTRGDAFRALRRWLYSLGVAR